MFLNTVAIPSPNRKSGPLRATALGSSGRENGSAGGRTREYDQRTVQATLASLDDRTLKDLGVRRSEIELADWARAVRSLAQLGGASGESSPTHCMGSIPGDWLTAGKHVTHILERPVGGSVNQVVSMIRGVLQPGPHL
jgi:Domain of unknown function (DUF1127)